MHQNDTEEERTMKVAFAKEKLRTEIIFQVVRYKRYLNSLTSLAMEKNNFMQLKQPGTLLAKKLTTLRQKIITVQEVKETEKFNFKKQWLKEDWMNSD